MFTPQKTMFHVAEHYMYRSDSLTISLSQKSLSISSDKSLSPDSFKNRLVSVLADLTENEWEFLEEKAMQLCGIDNESDINNLYSELPAGKDIEKEYPPVNSDKKDVG